MKNKEASLLMEVNLSPNPWGTPEKKKIIMLCNYINTWTALRNSTSHQK